MPVTMRRGAIALIDVLGFKGIWRHHPEEAVIRSLEALLEASQDDARQATAGPATTIDYVAPVFLSDTVAFGLAAKSVAEANVALEASGEAELFSFDADRLDSWTVWHMGNFLAHLMRRALLGEVPFAFRGAVAFGRFGMTDRFLIGEAVDEAATFHERANGAIVRLAPSAAKFQQAEAPSSVSKFIKYSIPTKARDGVAAGTWDTWAVLPWGEVDEPNLDLIDLFSRTLVTDDPSLHDDVERKRENTLAFLRPADEAAGAPMRAMLCPCCAASDGAVEAQATLIQGPYMRDGFPSSPCTYERRRRGGFRAARAFRSRAEVRGRCVGRRNDGARNVRTVHDRQSTSSRDTVFVSPSEPVTSRWHPVQIDASTITAIVIVDAHESEFARCMTAPLPVAIHPIFFNARASACSFPHAHRIDSTLGPHVRLRHVIRFPKGRRLP